MLISISHLVKKQISNCFFPVHRCQLRSCCKCTALLLELFTYTNGHTRSSTPFKDNSKLSLDFSLRFLKQITNKQAAKSELQPLFCLLLLGCIRIKNWFASSSGKQVELVT